MQESVASTSAKLAELCESDVDEMMARMDGVNKNWDEMKGIKDSKVGTLEKMLSDLSEYERKAGAAEEKISKAEKALPAESALVLDLPQMRNSLASIKNVKEQLEGAKPQLESTVAYGNELIAQDPDVDGSNVKRRNQELEDLYKNVDEKIEDEAKKMQDVVDLMEQYAKSSKDLKKDVAHIHEEVEANKPGLLSIDSLKEKDVNVQVSCRLVSFVVCYLLSVVCLFVELSPVGLA